MNFLSHENLMDIIVSALNRMDERLTGHGERVAYYMMLLLEQDPRFSFHEICKITWLILLHDIGSFQKIDISSLMETEFDHSFSHARYGYLFLKYFSPFPEYSQIILYHHCSRHEIDNSNMDDKLCWTAKCMQVIDMIDLYQISHPKSAGQEIVRFIDSLDTNRFDPDAIGAVRGLIFTHIEQGYVVQEKAHNDLLGILKKMDITEAQKEALLQTLVSSIDFRSHYTALHCAIMVQVSDTLAQLCQLSSEVREKIHIGATLHDLGKIAIPVHILESPGKLIGDEWETMKSHVVITNEILKNKVCDEVLQIAVRHHETLDGKGYPWGLGEEELSMPQRIVAVADIVSALSEERSYKTPFSLERIIDILEDMCSQGKLCPQVVHVLHSNSQKIYDIARKAALDASDMYDKIYKEYNSGRIMSGN